MSGIAFTYPRHLHRGEGLRKGGSGFTGSIVYIGNHVFSEGFRCSNAQFCGDLFFQRLSIGIFDVVGGMEVATVSGMSSYRPSVPIGMK